MKPDDAFTPRAVTSSEYVRELFQPDDTIAVLTRNRPTGHTVQTIAKAEAVVHANFQDWLAHQAASRYDVYVGMNPLKEGAYNRTKENIKEIRHVYLDLDRKGDESLETIRNSTEVPPPNFVLDTSPGKHQVVWKVTGFEQPEAEALLHDLAIRFDGDLAATDATRVLRLPGFPNHKLPGTFVVQARFESPMVWTPRDFTVDEDSRAPERSLGDQDSRRMPVGHKSQSERDWAYAKRALARGDTPEAVIQRIADYRADDKSDPDYYARHTVKKAQEVLLRSNPTERPTEHDGTEPKQVQFDH